MCFLIVVSPDYCFGYDAEDIDREIAADNTRADDLKWCSRPTRGTTKGLPL